MTERIKLHYLRPLLAAGGRSLEVGCGSAKLSTLLAREGLHVYGIDQSPSGLRQAARNVATVGRSGHFVRGDAFRLPFADDQFDLVFSTGLLEHFSNPATLMREMIRTLRPGGLFFSDVVPLKFSLVRSAWYLQGLHRTVDDELLRERGVTLLSAGLDEVPMAYKDIDEVMAAQRDLVEPLARFEPRLVKMASSGERPGD